TMVILFLALYGFAMMEKNKSDYEQAVARMQKDVAVTDQQKARAAQREKEAKVASDLEAKIAAQLPPGTAGVRLTSQRIVLTLASPVLFDSGSAELKAAAKPALAAIGSALKGLPNQVLVEGFTDDERIVSGPYKDNWELSAALAFAVIGDITKAGVAP